MFYTTLKASDEKREAKGPPMLSRSSKCPDPHSSCKDALSTLHMQGTVPGTGSHLKLLWMGPWQPCPIALLPPKCPALLPLTQVVPLSRLPLVRPSSDHLGSCVPSSRHEASGPLRYSHSRELPPSTPLTTLLPAWVFPVFQSVCPTGLATPAASDTRKGPFVESVN